MKLVKTIAAAAVLAMSSFATQASTITVGGVTWDPDFTNDDYQDFTSTLTLVQWWSNAATTNKTIASTNQSSANRVNPGTGELMGLTKFLDVNGSSSFVCSTCSLSLAFGGITYNSASNTFNTVNAWWKVFSNAVALNNFSSNSFSAAQSGQVFLEGNFSFFGLQSGGLNSGTSLGYMNVTGGLAKLQFDTNTISDSVVGITGADLQVSASVNYNTVTKTQQGSGGTVTGASVVSAPSSLAILGLGLVGLAGLTRRKQAK